MYTRTNYTFIAGACNLHTTGWLPAAACRKGIQDFPLYRRRPKSVDYRVFNVKGCQNDEHIYPCISTNWAVLLILFNQSNIHKRNGSRILAKNSPLENLRYHISIERYLNLKRNLKISLIQAKPHKGKFMQGDFDKTENSWNTNSCRSYHVWTVETSWLINLETVDTTLSYLPLSYRMGTLCYPGKITKEPKFSHVRRQE